MVNKPRQKGTSAETAVVSFLRPNGFPHAERRSLKGSQDWGDITGCPGLVWEVKYANGGIRMAEWMQQTQVEKTNASAEHGILVMKPEGLGNTRTGQWPTVMLKPDFLAVRNAATMFMAVDGPWHGYSFGTEGPYQYNEARLLASVAAEAQWPIFTGDIGVIAHSIMFQPRGTKENEDQWLVALPLAQLVVMLRLAGYGNPINFGEVFNETAPTPPDGGQRLDVPEPVLD